MRVGVQIYENDQPFMMKDVAIEFWKGWSDSTEVDDVFLDEKERQSQFSPFADHVFSGKRDMQYLSKRERMVLGIIPDEAIIAIKKFDSFNPKKQTPHAEHNELEVCVPIWSPHMEKTLLYALNAETAYKIENGNIYIWYKPCKGIEGSGFYKLKRFVF